MATNSISLLRKIFDDSINAHQRFTDLNLDLVVQAAEAVAHAVQTERKVVAFGNGGSATDAEHLVAELVGRFEEERYSLAGIALTANSAVVTAIGNDYGYERVFARQIEGLGNAGDIAFGISTSGQSPNVRVALEAAKARGMITIALTGRDGGSIGRLVDIHLNVAESSTPRIQEVHRTVLHAMCTLIDESVRNSL
ncbi:MAG TPA: SIS domain-containing protein [Vicinamibacterales bacterium]|jgi:D-sedoheptulose 7-phosphate isomerase